MRHALGGAVLALLLPGTASAHVTISPPFVSARVESRIELETPNERPPNATVELSVTAPPGIEVEGASAPPGWQATVDGSTVTWSGGRLVGRTVTLFPLTITPNVGAGTYRFAALQTYDDAAEVTWKVDLSVLPAAGNAAPGQHPLRALVAAVVGAFVIALSLVGLRRHRRRPLQE